jgi:microcystin-dependent protein|tara:strand:+ start:28 stop:1011 length:984 start_codon:yes stop_codon:yes gene_type:complete
MSNTHDYDIGNAVGATFRADLNTCLGDIQSLNSGSSDPSTTVAYKIWADTANNLLKIRNSANNGWLVLGSLTDAAHTNNFGLATKASPDFTGTVDSAGDIVMGGTGALKLPSGTTIQRPTAATGQIRFNSSTTSFEGYNGSAWGELANGVPVGSVFNLATTTVPTGFLECNGAAISRSTYASLFATISTTWGSGDGSSTFNLPDLRGQFVRGWDNSAGVDSGRSFASSQSDQNKSHNHSITDSGHFHHSFRSGNSGESRLNSTLTSSNFPASGTGAGNLNEAYNIVSKSDEPDVGRTSSETTGITISNDGSTEVRVKNYALMYVIKF